MNILNKFPKNTECQIWWKPSSGSRI